MFEGEDGVENENGTFSEGAFPNASVWARISTVAAGPIFNFILGFILAMILVSNTGSDRPVLLDVIDGYPAQEAGMQSGEFKWLLLATAVFLWVGGWLCWRLWRSGKATDRLSHYLSRGRLLWLTPLISAIGVVALVVLIRHPLMPVYIDILRKVVGG